MSKPWGGIGAWAAEAEREEAEERAAKAAAAATAPVDQSQSFPSLKESVNSKAGKKKKSMTLSEFYADSGVGGGDAGGYKGLTPDEMLHLPRGPKERGPDEMPYNRLGGGFSTYGRSGQVRGRDRDDGDGSWGGGGRRPYGGFEDERRGPPPRVSDFDQPSRADEVDNWKTEKKSLPALDAGGRQNRYGSLGGGGGVGGGASRADEVDNWAFGKKPLPSRSSTFGSGGFRDSEPDRWSRGGGLRDSERERPRLVLDPPKGDAGLNEAPVVKTNRPNPFGAARPREEVLAQKGLDWKKLDSEIEAKKTSRPSSAHSSRPSSAQSSRSEGPGLQGIENVVKSRPKVNPFGDAKPREVLLEEKGMDWRKIDLELEHRSVERPETEEEKILKEEIETLKKELEKESSLTVELSQESAGDSLTVELSQESAGDQPSLRDTLLQRERELEKLIRDLDDKVRFGQKAVERPGSGAGRVGNYHERTPSQSGSFEDSKNMEFMDRPRSRGTGDIWTRPADDRRTFLGGRERGFLGSRDLDRSRSRDKW